MNSKQTTSSNECRAMDISADEHFFLLSNSRDNTSLMTTTRCHETELPCDNFNESAINIDIEVSEQLGNCSVLSQSQSPLSNITNCSSTRARPRFATFSLSPSDDRISSECQSYSALYGDEDRSTIHLDALKYGVNDEEKFIMPLHDLRDFKRPFSNVSLKACSGQLISLPNALVTKKSDCISEESSEISDVEKFRFDEEMCDEEKSFQSQSSSSSRTRQSKRPSTSKVVRRPMKRRQLPADSIEIQPPMKVKEKSHRTKDASLVQDEDEKMDIDTAEMDSENDRPETPNIFQRSQSCAFFGVNQNNNRDNQSPFTFLEVKYSLQSIKRPAVCSSAFASITSTILLDLLKKWSEKEMNEKFVLIDCRYPFEYEGGHIRGAVSLFDPANLENFFFPQDLDERARLMAKIPIFYCEFSRQRGPTMAHELRSLDRKINLSNYPGIDYPEMYLLQHGYRNFYFQHKIEGFCVPDGYVKMKHRDHAQEVSQYRFHRTRTTASVYHSIATERLKRGGANLPQLITGPSGLQHYRTPLRPEGYVVRKHVVSLNLSPDTPESPEQSASPIVRKERMRFPKFGGGDKKRDSSSDDSV